MEAEMNDQAAITLSAPEAGKRHFGLCRNACV
jgi:hypothetical protein